jgi:tetratricopeptide (TPR) repeat protein
MDGKKILIGAGIIAAILLLIFGGMALGNLFSGGSESELDKIRNNKLKLAEDYLELGEYDEALKLVNDLLIQNAEDKEARDLRDRIINAKKNAQDLAKQEEQAKQDKLRESLEELSSTIEESSVPQKIDRGTTPKTDLAGLSQAEKAKQKKINDLIDQGIKDMESERYVKAREKFDQAIELDDDTARLILGKGNPL